MDHIRFSAAGPFKIPCDKHETSSRIKQIRSEHTKNFWKGHPESFADKSGCYVFALSASGGYMPWYVGKTKKVLSKEIFTPDKLNKFNKPLFKGKKATPVIFFIARSDERKIIPQTVLSQLEKFLIQEAKNKNPDLINKVNAKKKEDWSIDGVYRPKKGTSSKKSRVFKKMMGL